MLSLESTGSVFAHGNNKHKYKLSDVELMLSFGL